MGIPLDADPEARAECPRCYALVRVARWREHDAWDMAIRQRLLDVERALEQPAPEPELHPWPTTDDDDGEPARPAGPYAPDLADRPSL